MSMDARDIEWRCGCGHTNPDFDEKCNGCGQERYPEMELASEPVSRRAHNPESEVRLLGEPCKGHGSAVSAEYAREVREYLTEGKNQTRPANAHPLLSEEEAEEMVGDFLLSVPAAVFAAKLESRDIAVFERLCDPYPERIYPDVAMN